jgi:hypothetical protein
MSLIRYAGIWSVTQYYTLNEMVNSPIDSNAYVLQITNLTGGSDPSVASPNWLLVPSGGGGGVTTLNTMSGAVELQSADGLFTYNNSSPPTIYFQRAFGTYGTYTEATGGSPTVTVVVTGLTATGVVSLCYVHAGSGGASQFIKSIVPAANSCTFTFNTNVDIGDQIIWQVLYFGA